MVIAGEMVRNRDPGKFLLAHFTTGKFGQDFIPFY